MGATTISNKKYLEVIDNLLKWVENVESIVADIEKYIIVRKKIDMYLSTIPDLSKKDKDEMFQQIEKNKDKLFKEEYWYLINKK